MIVIAGSARLSPDRKEDLTSVASRMAARSRQEPGCVDYRFSFDIDDPDTVRIFECWEDGDALERHFATEHFAEFGSAISGALEGDSEFTRYEVTAAGPLFG